MMVMMMMMMMTQPRDKFIIGDAVDHDVLAVEVQSGQLPVQTGKDDMIKKIFIKIKMRYNQGSCRYKLIYFR